MSNLVLIDGHAILHRAYHAYPPTLRTKNGELTNAVYGFTRILLATLEKISPKYVVVAFDLPKPTFRHKRFKDYKAHRPKVDDELKQQIPRAREVVKTLNIPFFQKEGFEADDIIGTLAKKAKADVVIVTGDKDALQLINSKTTVFVPGRARRPDKIYNKQEFVKEYGFQPKLLVDYKALIGDPSDAIPGVKGIGPKTAKKLITEFQTIENIYKNIEKIENKVAAKLKSNKKTALLSKELAEIITNVPLKFSLKKAKLLDYNKQKVIKLFEQLEFSSLIDKLPGEKKVDKKPEPVKKDEQIGLF
jgi:DNA polymerase-1